MKYSPSARRQKILNGILLAGGFLAVVLVNALVFGSRGPTEASFTLGISAKEPSRYSYDVSEVVVDSDGMRLQRHNATEDVVYLDDIALPDDASLTGFLQQAEIGSGSSITYQLTSDYTYWYWHNGNAWVKANGCETY